MNSQLPTGNGAAEPSDAWLSSVSQRWKRRKRMPPPSKRCGRKDWLSLQMRPPRSRRAQPVQVPRSSASSAVPAPEPDWPGTEAGMLGSGAGLIIRRKGV
jgi:hypothetical protein